MNKLIIAVNIILVIAVGYLFFYSNRVGKEVVYVNNRKLLSQYKGMLAAQKTIEEKSKEWQANIDTLTNDVQNQMKKYEKERANLSAKELKLTEELLRNKQQQLVQYQQAIRQKAQEEDMKLKEKIVAEVNAYIKDYGDKNSYDYILGATDMGNLLYGKEVLDVTDDVLKGMNAAYKGK